MDSQRWEIRCVVYLQMKNAQGSFWDKSTAPDLDDFSMEGGLSEMGRECWEVVSHQVVDEGSNLVHFFTFKRPDEY